MQLHFAYNEVIECRIEFVSKSFLRTYKNSGEHITQDRN